MHVASLHRFPVKGLSPEPLQSVDLLRGAFFPGDRLFAFENGPSGFDPDSPAYQPKTRFLMLMKNARLAELETRYDDASHRLSIARGGCVMASGDVRTAEGCAELEACLQSFCGAEARGPVRLLEAPEGFRFTDSIRSGFVSILNLASVADLQANMGVVLDPLRFRANVAVAGWEPWIEDRLVGSRLRFGEAELKVLKPIDRCLATHVNPRTAQRDADVTGALQVAFGRATCGIYARVDRSGRVRLDDPVQILP
jgi:uncharacterized protein YcbX